MEENPQRNGLLAKLPGGDQLPQLKDRVTGLPGAGCEMHTDAGTSAWISGLKQRAFNWGPARMPLFGIGCFLQLTPNSAPVTFVCIPGENVSKAGLLDFSEAPAFFASEKGSELLKSTGHWFTFDKTSQISYCPYSALVIPIVGFYTEDKDKQIPTTACFWHYPVFNIELASQVGEQCWKSFIRVGREAYAGPKWPASLEGEA